jgi:hypothetical protein
MRTRAVLIPIVVALSCYGENIVVPDPNVAPQLHATVFVRQDQSLHNDVLILLSLGTDAKGNDNGLGNSPVLVAGSVVTGNPTADGMAWSWADSAGLRGNVDIRFPTVATYSPTPVSVSIPIEGRDGPRIIDHVAGQDLTLRLLGVTDSIAGLTSREFQRWSLAVRDARKPRNVFVNGTGIASTFALPNSLMSMIPGDSLHATVTASKSYEVAGAPFRTGLFTETQVTWIVRVVAP